MLEFTRKKVKDLDEYKIWTSHDGLTDPDEIYDALLKEAPLFIHK